MINYHNKKIVIIGLGITGISCINFFLSQGIIPRVMDNRISPPGLANLPKQIEYYLGGININWLLESDLIIKSPGIKLDDLILNKIFENGIEIIGDIELFCREAEAPIIAITGTNGKSTVTMMVAEMARAAGWLVSVGGNLGTPALTLLKFSTQLYVLELSSFQLETTYSLKAFASTVLNITEDHMDRYSNVQQYADSKLRIYKNSYICIFNAEDNMTVPKYHLSQQYISFGANIGNYSLYKHKENIWLQIHGKNIINTNKMKISGHHNYINALAALALADTINIPRVDSLSVLSTFSGLPHRFQLAHQAKGVRWINNSKATNVSSTIAALKDLNIQGRLWLLLGGDSKSADFSSLINYLRNNDIRIFCFGQDGKLLATLCPEITTYTKTLQDAMIKIAEQVANGDIVLLSPACASLDQFLNFEHRGEVFTQLAKKLS
ncbi:UDP-N-acetylmuramoyl-L-alanine--D-glutamate ligase [Pantoea sp. Mhis]|uniref:UDP-N-acetylmuramoyl-L-alanine--D-glutamate ligase n=1 Tax=Pantoea sp. Mhis TaxID=2576759 RepID=UPI00135944B2|nr:UDP-N-acetylmuramoyl-L-alanine--D-glutamate ligase [Pantoea sp. Mhis]MXP56493.1 UDP-N-acetylmuramoyl-L-alanine--D-glutamate ligase [Pantoea sp. Mhis]